MEVSMAVQPRGDWLQHAGQHHVCPLCAAAGLYESDYLGALCVQLIEEGVEREAATVVRELCAQDIAAFGQACREAGADANAVLAVHLARLVRLADQLAELDCDSWPTTAECALCLARNEFVLLCAHRLLAGLEESGGRTGTLVAQAGGLCAAHFATCWQASPEGADRDALRRVQLDAVQRLVRAARVGLSGDEFDTARAEAVAVRATAITTT
jgi:hypothetical protein